MKCFELAFINNGPTTSWWYCEEIELVRYGAPEEWPIIDALQIGQSTIFGEVEIRRINDKEVNHV